MKKRTAKRNARPFLDPALLEEATRQTLAALAAQEIVAALTGGYAMQLYGSRRLTGDIDVLAEQLPSLGFEKERNLSFGGISTQAPNGVPLDIIVRQDDWRDLYVAALENAVDVEGLDVVAPEYLLAIKIAARRDKDIDDAETLLLEELVDLPEARVVIRKYLGLYGLDEMENLGQVAAWKRSRGLR